MLADPGGGVKRRRRFQKRQEIHFAADAFLWRGWECYLEDLFEAGPTVLTDGALDPAEINPVAARHDIHYQTA
ncbi:hypothetical protein AB0C34_14940 [Nocardia sp. NPDC049220]|uniref:hypothetical protein n=1 Tax=Nocardia sp. NPDC049220 TaxID=3155273 RepID=UPI00340E4F52